MIKIYDITAIDENEIFGRAISGKDVSAPVSEIIKNVKSRGDAALYEYAAKFERSVPEKLKVSEDEIERAFAEADKDFISVLHEATENISRYHSLQKREGYKDTPSEGIVTGQRVLPLSRVGIYVPGGTAAYPSTVLMNAIPAKIAGVEDIVMVSPPNEAGGINKNILAAAKIAGVTEIYKIGGAQAVAALAYGTESVPKVDKIVGPGNAFVAEAKKQVYGKVDIDMIAGPSEILVIADEKSNPAFVAADLLSQAEHDTLASAVLVTNSLTLAKEVQREIESQLLTLSRRDIASQSIENNGKIIVVPDIENAIEVSNRIAPEHLEICTDNSENYLPKIKNAGSVFLGRYCPEPMGDYFAGPNHTLPTMGTAAFYSPLSVDDFTKTMQFSSYTKDALERVYKKVALFAETEGLTAHARAVTIRFENEDKS